jgi:hypothetical protein
LLGLEAVAVAVAGGGGGEVHLPVEAHWHLEGRLGLVTGVDGVGAAGSTRGRLMAQ